jgi:hypothetical protein
MAPYGGIVITAGSTVVEAKGSHAVYVSQPQAVALLIEEAAKGALTAGTAEAETSLASTSTRAG